MRTATVADLRNNFRRISSWIEHGETVCILKRGRAFAQLTGVPERGSSGVVLKPDIMAQLREVWGNRVFSSAEVRAMRDAEMEEHNG